MHRTLYGSSENIEEKIRRKWDSEECQKERRIYESLAEVEKNREIGERTDTKNQGWYIDVFGGKQVIDAGLLANMSVLEIIGAKDTDNEAAKVENPEEMKVDQKAVVEKTVTEPVEPAKNSEAADSPKLKTSTDGLTPSACSQLQAEA